MLASEDSKSLANLQLDTNHNVYDVKPDKAPRTLGKIAVTSCSEGQETTGDRQYELQSHDGMSETVQSIVTKDLTSGTEYLKVHMHRDIEDRKI